MRKALFIAVIALLLIAVNYSIWQKEYILRNGEIFLLELAPTDPRSLMQGDYMILRYNLPNAVTSDNTKLSRSGYLVVSLNEKKQAQFLRVFDPKTPLASGEHVLKYRARAARFGINNIRLGAEEFFFQEGHAKYYDNACYGELRVTKSGDSVLVGLRDKDLVPLQPKNNNEPAVVRNWQERCPDRKNL